jgi:hypothetical protein
MISVGPDSASEFRQNLTNFLTHSRRWSWLYYPNVPICMHALARPWQLHARDP